MTWAVVSGGSGVSAAPAVSPSTVVVVDADKIAVRSLIPEDHGTSNKDQERHHDDVHPHHTRKPMIAGTRMDAT
ncbi:hypothetical protein [Arthrobacter sp. AET 35A]|uniref:hypothetical protein n=1 Tax=Arthrobacter sp. AET 35A TaxID=2292643 RepID=UPI00178065B1|nr:hypothetical protein [Arthrobacter sp. AET 35A]